MCMEDIRIGRRMAGTESRITLTASSLQVVLADPKRIHLCFFPPVSGTVTLSSHGPVVANVGITMSANDHPLHLDIKEHGLLVIGNWFAIHSVGGPTLSILEGRLEDV